MTFLVTLFWPKIISTHAMYLQYIIIWKPKNKATKTLLQINLQLRQSKLYCQIYVKPTLNYKFFALRVFILFHELISLFFTWVPCLRCQWIALWQRTSASAGSRGLSHSYIFAKHSNTLLYVQEVVTLNKNI